MATEAIASTKAQADSATISIASGASIQVTADAKLVGDEKVLLLHAPDGTNFVPCDTFNGAVVLDAGINRRQVNGPGDFRLRKTATGAAKSVDYDA